LTEPRRPLVRLGAAEIAGLRRAHDQAGVRRAGALAPAAA
jgi:hypothetical protein